MRRRLDCLRTLVAVRDIQPPRLLTSTLLAILASLLVCWPVWPGLMSYDSLFAYRQSIDGVETADWPPMHDYLFYLSRTLTGGPGGLFAAQTLVLFFSASAIISMFTRSRWRHLLGFALFVACCFYFPTLFGTLIVNWKDVPLASFSLLAIVFWLLAVRLSSQVMLALVAVALAVALSVRLNSLPLLLPFLVLVLVQPTGVGPHGARAIAAIVVVASITIAYMSTQWRLPDFKPLPPLGQTFAGVQLWDLIGTTACVGTSLLPPSYAGKDALSVAELREIYDPRHIDLTMSPRDGVKALSRPTAGEFSEVAQSWTAAIRNHPRCYLRHRLAIFGYQMGFAEHIFIPTHGGIDTNNYDISFRHPESAAARIQFVVTGADAWLRRPFWLYLLAAGTTVLVVVRGRQSVPVVLILASGALLYVASFFYLAPAADARYIFPSNAFCALLLAIALAQFGERREANAKPAIAIVDVVARSDDRVARVAPDCTSISRKTRSGLGDGAPAIPFH